jgi:5-methylcytosine-specific restriction endonuclease McrA
MNRREWSARPNRESLSKRNRLLRDFVHARDGACVYCGSKKNLQVDHLIPRSKGGRDDPRRIVSACRSCNCSRQAKTIWEWERYARKKGIIFDSVDIAWNAQNVEGALKKLLTIV